MEMTRRAFTILTTGSIALTVLGDAVLADGAGEVPKRAKLATEPFTIGPRSKYKTAGLYQDYRDSKGVWVVSDGKQIVVFSAVCTHKSTMTRWDDAKKQFLCPSHRSTFDLEGTNTGGKATEPLLRCSLKLAKGADGAEEVEVDPTRLLKKADNAWNDPTATLALG